ncbi:hypothetical protein H0E84_17315 [Luteimonas sp. SJ-92]|uniref:Toxin VasX N-terminal region domain-containing protein n=2 Tax=Luteimonas salinisoli TaxID=2752307 RepID=A0A853JFK1_9GAMM|nr:hypothetical protein [Luteimonas salinisoli]
MRTLRRGYVLAYYETPHTPEINADQGWQVFSVDDGGYLTPHSLDTVPLVGSDEQPTFSCQRTAGYASAMLFVIPNAKQTDRVWVAYSDHPWSEKVRQAYASSEVMRSKRMTCINARDASCDRSIALSESNIRRLIADYADLLPDSVLKGNPHQRLVPRNGLGHIWDQFPVRDEVQPGRRGEAAHDVTAEAEKIVRLGRNQFTVDDAMIVSVCDVVGATAEVAQLRMTLCSTASEWTLQRAEQDADKAQWMLMSALSVDGLLNIIEQQGDAKRDEYPSRYGKYQGQRVTRDEFERMKEAGDLPPDATFMSFIPYRGMSSEERKLVGTGTIQIPTTAEIDRETGNLKEDVLDKLDVDGGKHAYRAYLDTYQLKAKEDEERRSQVERDYHAWLDSPARKQVTDNDFDEDFIVDGMFYCDCVGKLTFAGPLTENGLEWYQKFLTDDPEDKENLLLRALLGNQKSAFTEWVAKKSGPYGRLKSIVSELETGLKKVSEASPGELTEANKRMLRWLPYFKIGLAGMASPVLTVAGAVATGLSKRQQILAAFRRRLEILAGVIAGQSSGSRPLALLKVQLPLQEAARLWRQQIGALQNSMRTFAGNVRGERVQSLVLNGAIALEARGASPAGDALIDVYLWASDAPDAIGDALESAKDLPSRVAAGATVGAGALVRRGLHVLRPSEANVSRAWEGTARTVTRTQLDKLARNSVVLASNGSALLAAGSGVFSTLALFDAWGKFEHGSADERENAATSLLTSALGVSSAFLALGTEMAKQAAREGAERGLKRAAGLVGAVATMIDAVQTAISGYKEGQKGDKDAERMMYLQGVFLIGAAGMGVAAALTGGSVPLLGLSVTGWGLILAALGIITGFVVAALQDSPTEEWAARSTWGTASDKWGSHRREQEELNKLLMGVRVDFDLRSRYSNAGNYGRSVVHHLNPLNRFRDLGKAVRGERPGPQMMREAWARIMMPEVLLESVPFMIKLVAKRKDGNEARVAYYGRKPNGAAWSTGRESQQQDDTIVVNPDAKEESKAGIWTLELSAHLDIDVYEGAWAEVLIYADPLAEEAPVVEHILRES